jgi:hypothetical protein
MARVLNLFSPESSGFQVDFPRPNPRVSRKNKGIFWVVVNRLTGLTGVFTGYTIGRFSVSVRVISQDLRDGKAILGCGTRAAPAVVPPVG